MERKREGIRWGIEGSIYFVLLSETLNQPSLISGTYYIMER